MATGSATLFNEYQLDVGKGVHVLGTDALYVAIVDDTITPAADDATPRWADYSANEVTDAGNYVAGGIALTTMVYAMVSDVATLTADDILIAIHASGFLDGYFAILYNGDATNDEAIGFWDLGGPVSEQAGPVSIEFPAGVVAEFPANVAA